MKLQISGHTDNVGAAQSNLLLSKKRAQAVKYYIQTKGVEEQRISALFLEKQILSQKMIRQKGELKIDA